MGRWTELKIGRPAHDRRDPNRNTEATVIQPDRTAHVPWIIWWAVGLHTVWGSALLLGGQSITRLIALVGLQEYEALGIPPELLGVILIICSFMAVCSLVRDTLSNRVAFLLLLPQYSVLVLAFLSDAWAIATGQVSGQTVDRILLLVLLWPVLFAGVLHTLAIIERHTAWKP